MSNKSDQTVLITGSSGFLAAWIVKYALAAGYRVRGTVRDPSNAKKTKHLRDLPGASERLELVALDLEKSDQAAFDKAAEGCDIVLHTASPFPVEQPKDEDVLIKPAVRGAVSALQAAHKAGTVKRFVLTSSVAAMSVPKNGEPLNEKDWTDVTKPGHSAYVKSKTLAERAAWDFVSETKPNFEFCTTQPVFIVGPSLSSERVTSAEVGIRMLNGKMPMIPETSFGIVDVRDCAIGHIRAMEAPADVVKGRRFILCRESKWMAEIAQLMRAVFEPMGYKIPTRKAPYFLIWVLSFFDPAMSFMLSRIGKFSLYDSTPSKEVLGLEYRLAETTFSDYGHSLVYHGLAQKLPGYKPPSEGWTPESA